MIGERRIGHLLLLGSERLRSSGSASPRLDAELLLSYVLGTDRTGVLAHPEAELGPHQLERYWDGVGRREKGEPIAYIRGIKEFFGYAFVVDNRALIPRPETELLVEMALARISGILTSAPRPAGTPPVLIADVGTGSGAIAVSVALQCRRRGYAKEVHLVASDVDAVALGLARENGVGHGVADLIDFVEADLIPQTERPFDIVLANLPYIPSAEVAKLPVAASFEPRAALDGGRDGLALIGRLLTEMPAHLSEPGLALIEIGSDQAGAVAVRAASVMPGRRVIVHNDLAGLARVVEVGPVGSALE